MRLHHIALSITNVETTLAWYQAVLDVCPERRVERPDLGVTVYFLASGQLRLELFAFETPTPLPDYRKAVDTDIRVCGTKHFALEVDDLDAMLDKARLAGTRHIDGPHWSYDRKNLFAFVADPSGNLVEFLHFPDTS